uniref:Uncharacterized protein n=1 Tax=Cuerna arida TaxID=1464854 RepID=A0A1B6EJH2_9HEMI
MCSHGFLRDDTVRKSLQPPYTGPYQVVSRDEKTISIIINGQTSRVSIDRVKPAYILAEEPQKESRDPPKFYIKTPSVTRVPDTARSKSPPTYTTRSGRQVRFKKP